MTGTDRLYESTVNLSLISYFLFLLNTGGGSTKVQNNEL